MAADNNHQKNGAAEMLHQDGAQTLTRGVQNLLQEEQTLTGRIKKLSQDNLTLTGGARRRHDDFTLSRAIGAGTDELLDKLDWEVGDIIDGKYEVMSILGRGGMGIVYKIIHREWKLDLAVKMPLPHLVADEASKKRFVREAQTWVNLGLHPNIVQCWYVRELGGVPRLFMDYVGGGSLKQWIDQGKVRPGEWATILDLIIQACDGLEYAHEQGMQAHRDVKPANMLLTNNGELLVTDFGLAKHLDRKDIEGGTANPSSHDHQHTTTMTGGESGTPEYSAPEQWDPVQRVDFRADIYALGVVLFELCCGRRPFDDGSHSEPPHVLIGRHLAIQAPDPREFHQDIPQSLVTIILKCLAKEPDERIQSMTAVREELTGVYEEVVKKRYRRAVPRAVELRADAINNQAVSLMDLGKTIAAFKTWKEALKLDPYHPESIYNQALFEWTEGKITDDEVIRRLEDIRHTGRRANLYRGFIHLERAAADEAETEFVEALKDPVLAMSGETWQLLGDARMAQEKFSEAEETYQQSIQLMPEALGNLERMTLAQIKTRQHNDLVVFPWQHCSRVFDGRHEKSVTAVTVTPGGQFLVSGSSDSTLQLWNLTTREHLQTYDRYRKEITAVAVTPDSRSIISGSDDGTIWLWDLNTAKHLQIFEGHTGGITAVAVVPNGRFLVSGSQDTTLQIWDIATAKPLWSFNGHEEGITSLTVTPDSYCVVSGNRDKTLRLWQLATGKCLKIIKGHSTGITAVALTPDGSGIVSGSEDGTVWLWEIETAMCLRVFKGHSGKVTSVAVTPDGRFVISGSDDQTLRLWDIMTAQCLRTFKGHEGGVTAIALAPDGRFVASGSTDTTVRLWNLDLEAPRYKATMRVCRQQNLEKIQTSTKRFWERMTWAKTAWEKGKATAAYKYLVQARTVSGYERAPEALALNAALGQILPRKGLHGGWLLGTLEGHKKDITAVAVTPDGQFVISGSKDNTLRLWDLETRKCLRIFQGHKGGITSVAVTPDNRFVVSGSDDNTLRLWDLVSGTCLRIYKGHTLGVTAVTLTPYGQFIISGSKDRTLRMWNPATTECVQIFKGHKKSITAVRVTPDRQFAISACSGRNLTLWNLTTGDSVVHFEGHKSGVTAVEMTPNGQFALSGSNDNTLRMWDINTGQCLSTFQGHEAEVASLAITPDARFAISASHDKSLRLWNCNTGECVWSFKGHKSGVTAVALTPDARFAISGGSDTTLKLWELDWELDPDKPTEPDRQKKTKSSRGTGRITSLFDRTQKK